MKLRHFIVLLFIGFAARLAAQEPGEFVLIANASRPEAHLFHEDVARIFLRKDLTWPQGGEVKPVDQAGDLPVRERFSQAIFGRSAKAILRFWLQQVFSGRSIPPAVLSSDAEVLDYVAKTPGAIGYVGSGTKVAGVKILRIRE